MKSKRNIILVILILIGIFSLILASTYFYLKEYAGKDKTVKISVIVYGSSSGRWDTLLQGVDQACLNFGSEVNFVSMMSVKDAEEQKILLDREIANGADGIIIAVTDSELMTQEVREASGKIPLVVVETGISDTEGITFVSADNYSMGLNLARSIPMLQSKKTIAVIMENVNRSSINERYQGFLDYIKNTDYSISEWVIGEEEQDPIAYIQRMMKHYPVDMIAALDDRALEAAAQAIINSDNRLGVYGIGSTSKAVHYLDLGHIKSIVFQNEFNMGYLSIQELMNVRKKQKSKTDIEIEFRTLNKETMYLPANQRLVFPMIQ